MKPRTKLQQQVAKQSKRLAPISKKQCDWAFENCFEHSVRRLKNGMLTCLECGHSWQKTYKLYKIQSEYTCPNCKVRLKIIDTQKQKFNQKEYLRIITTCNGLQVLRYFFLEKWCKVGNPAQIFCREVVQHWIVPNGKSEIMARSRGMSVMYYDVWNWSSELEIRREHPAHLITPFATYPYKRFIADVKRNGFCGEFHNISPQILFCNILSNSKMETLLKSMQFDLLRYFSVSNFKDLEKYWASIKICIRNKYVVKDASLWCDYVDLLRFFKKDRQNAKYVCPANLKAQHDKLMCKKQVWQEREDAESRKHKIEEDEMQYQELKWKFLGLEFSDGQLHVKVLQDVNEFYEEGRMLKHCVYTNDYFLKSDTLIFSAQIDEQRIETVEVSLDTLKVIQSRGVCNKNTEYHDQIIELVNRNAYLIRKRMTA